MDVGIAAFDRPDETGRAQNQGIGDQIGDRDGIVRDLTEPARTGCQTINNMPGGGIVEI
jgi:hypothetical protein